MKNKVVFGVGFLLFSNGNGNTPRIFTVEELKSKPEIHKEAGMASFPLETFKTTDVIFENTIMRLIQEEIGIPRDLISIYGLSPCRFQLIPGRKDILTVYGFGKFHGNTSEIFFPIDTDIKFAGWKTFDELCSLPTRVETIPILEHFQKNHQQELLNRNC